MPAGRPDRSSWELWNRRLATGETRLTAAHVTAALPAVAARVAEYHQRRYRELEAGGLAAVSVASAFQAGMDATATEVDAALAATGEDAAFGSGAKTTAPQGSRPLTRIAASTAQTRSGRTNRGLISTSTTSPACRQR